MNQLRARAVADPARSSTSAVSGVSADLSPGVATARTVPAVTRAATPSSVQLVDASFTFLDPPEPGARASFSLKVDVLGGGSDPRLALVIPRSWLDGYQITASAPAAADDTDGQLVFPPLRPGPATLSFDVVARGERVDPPQVHVQLADSGQAVGDAHPRSVAPRPRPGPVSALRIPRLGLNVAVVPTTWEPPAFLVGQLRDSANVTLRNTVLVGHLGGAAGDVFKHLDELQPGDSVVAVSRGLDYPFMVSRKQIRPSDDSQLTGSDTSPRLALMTCDGTWAPLAHNYSDRVWIVAEPPQRAWDTIAYNALHPATATPVTASSDATAEGGEATPVPELAALASGLGAERATLDASLGPPLGETAGKLVVYRQGSAEYHVAYTPDPPRARLVAVLPVGHDPGLSVPTAVLRARAEFPSDAAPRMQAPDAVLDMVVERWASPALAAASGPPGGEPGDFLAAYARDPSGAVTRVIVAAGDDLDAALRDAAK